MTIFTFIYLQYGEEEEGVPDDDYTPPQHDYLPPGLQEHEDSLSQVSIQLGKPGSSTGNL